MGISSKRQKWRRAKQKKKQKFYWRASAADVTRQKIESVNLKAGLKKIIEAEEHKKEAKKGGGILEDLQISRIAYALWIVGPRK